MSQEVEAGDVEAKCSSFFYWYISAFSAARYGAAAAAVGYAVYAFVMDGQWLPFFVWCGAVAACEGMCWAPVLALRAKNAFMRREVERREAQAREMRILLTHQQALLEQRRARVAALKAENTQMEALISALKTQAMELERLQIQRRLEQEAREARRRLDLAVAAIEADLLEAAAWRMGVTAKQIELKLQQADYFRSLSEIEENAQERILQAYEVGHDHGERGIVIPAKFTRHLRVVGESA